MAARIENVETALKDFQSTVFRIQASDNPFLELHHQNTEDQNSRYQPQQRHLTQVGRSVLQTNSAERSLSLRSRERRTKRVAEERQEKNWNNMFVILDVQSSSVRIEPDQELFGSDADKKYEFETAIMIQLVPWLGFRRTKLSFVRPRQSWMPLKFQIRQYSVRSEDDLVFRFCSTENLEGVKEYLSRGLASPLDMTPDGGTLLHVRSAVPCDQII